MVQKRPSGYYFRWIFPPCIYQILNQKEFVRTLKTKNKHIAYQRSSVYFDFITNMKSLKEAYEVAVLSKESFEEMVREIWDKARHAPIYPAMVERHADRRLVEAKEGLERISHIYRGTHPKGGFRPKLFPQYQMEAAVRLGLELDKEGIPYGKLEELNKADQLALVLLGAEKIYFERVQEAFQPYGRTDNKINPIVDKIGEGSGWLISKVFKDFIEHKTNAGKLKEKLKDNYVNYFNNFLYFQKDQDINNYTRKNFINFYQSALQLPKRNLKKYRTRSLEDIFSETHPEDIPEDETISKKLIVEHRKLLQGIYKYARDQEIIKVTVDLSMPFSEERGTRYSDFNNRDVLDIFSALTEGTDHYWITHIAAFSGMRSGEICQLTSSDFKEDADSGIRYILVNAKDGKSVKTEAGVRQVPIHKKLKELGLLSFAESKDGQLFPKTDSKAITRWFAPFKSQLGISPANDFGNRRVFHSFRHTFITKASDGGISQQLIATVVGHEAKKSITDNYNHSNNLKSLSTVTDAIDYGY
jgi:integrase